MQGDGRSYSHPVALFHTVGSGDKRGNSQRNVPWDDLEFLASIIPRYVHGVNRVVLMFGEKYLQFCPSSCWFLSASHLLHPRPESEEPEITPTHLIRDVLDQLRESDAVVNEELAINDLMRRISQVPVVLLPLPIDGPKVHTVVCLGSEGSHGTLLCGVQGHRSIVIRTLITNDFMTGRVAKPGVDIPEAVVEAMIRRLLQVPGIARVAYDLTPKPPATTEWE